MNGYRFFVKALETFDKMKGTEERATELLPLLIARDVSLDRTPATEEGGLTPADRLASPTKTPEEEACAADETSRMSEALHQAVGELSLRERQIMHRRWLTDSPMTLEELGADFGVSKERVRQIEERAKRRIRARIEEIVKEPPLAKSA